MIEVEMLTIIAAVEYMQLRIELALHQLSYQSFEPNVFTRTKPGAAWRRTDSDSAVPRPISGRSTRLRTASMKSQPANRFDGLRKEIPAPARIAGAPRPIGSKEARSQARPASRTVF
jgi:hypothetical protein